MSRISQSYDEEWQRRKNLLIRSLFHDITILTPVTEESYDSDVPVYHEPSVPASAIQRPQRPDTPESPLPPLIIEREPIPPNKHDEPEKYYQKLYKKIKSIYIKLFIENMELSSNDNVTSDNISSVSDVSMNSDDDQGIHIADNEDQNIHTSGDARDSSISINSNGYNADNDTTLESTLIDVVNYTKSEVLMCDEESNNQNEEEISEDDSDTSQNDNQEIVIKGSGAKAMNLQEHSEESQQADETEQSDKISNDGDISDVESNKDSNTDKEQDSNGHNNELRRDNRKTKSKEYDDHNSCEKSTESEESNNEAAENQQKEEFEGLNKVTNYEPSFEPNKIELNSKELVILPSVDRSEFIIQNVEAMEDDAQMNSSSEDSDYRQITTEAIVHIDGPQDGVEKDSIIYEDSIRSVILPTKVLRSLVKPCNVGGEDRIEEFVVLDKNEDPDSLTTFELLEAEIMKLEIEAMRTPQPVALEDSFLSANHSDSVSSTELITVPQNMTALTSTPQDGADHKMSNDIQEVLTSIFNASNGIDENLSRKRKYEDVAAQTDERVSLSDFGGSFIVGTPKIFRLCSCVDHVCC